MGSKQTLLNVNKKNGHKSHSVLVTGSTGFLGSRVVEALLCKGFRVRAFARKTSRIEKLEKLDVEICFGDIADLASLRPAFEGSDYVVHAAADTQGTIEGGNICTIQGTKNVLALCKEVGVKKLVYISSCSVYGVADYKKGYVVTEDSSLERAPEARGAYSNAKFQAEKVVLKAMEENTCPIVCLRPGTIFGPGGEIYTPMMGFSLGTRLFGIIGNGKFVLPLVYIDNLVDAIITAMEKEESSGKIYNVVDPDNITKKVYIKSLIKKLYPQSKCFYIPYSLLYSSVFVQEILSWILRRKPFLTRYRLTSSQKNILYDSSKIQRELNWLPPFSFKDALDNVVQYEKDRHEG